MNAEQLNSARLARWSQNGEARLTLESAAEWLNTIGFCPYLPMNPPQAVPSASFLEAVVGRPAQVPSAGERSRANDLLVRLIENSAAVPLKLGSSLGEQPDFIASAEALRYIYALRGDRNFKSGPSTVGNEKVTPLALHCWQAIQEQGPLEVAALQPILGRDMTQAAILRALHELWSGMYIFPVLSANGKPAQWELVSRRFPQQVAAGSATGQAESHSAMVSLYLHAAVAATEEEILTLLSPFAPQSKLREVIRGLGSMRQLDIIDIGGRAHVCLQGGLLTEMVTQLSEELLAAPRADSEIVTGGSSEAVGVLSASGELTIEIEREPQPAFRTSANEGSAEPGKAEPGKFVPKKFVPKKFIPKRSATGESTGKRFGLQAAAGRTTPDRGTPSRFSRADSSTPRSFSAAGDASSSKNRGFRGGRSGGPSSSGRKFTARGSREQGPREPGSDASEKRWQKPGARSGFRPAGFKASGFKPAKPWRSKDADARSEDTKPWMKRATSTPDAPEGSRDQQPDRRRLEKPREGSARFETGSQKPYAAKPSGSRSAGFKRSGPKPWTAKSGTFKGAANRAKSAKPWHTRNSNDPDAGSSGARDQEKSAKRWDKSGAGAQGMGKRADGKSVTGHGAQSAERRPWQNRPVGRKPSGFTSSGFQSAGSRSAEAKSDKKKSAGSKPWVSKGAESRVGSAKSYAARSSRVSDGDAPGRPGKANGKPYAKAGGATPWAKRAFSERGGSERAGAESGRAGIEPPRRDKAAPPSRPGGKRDAKPFWAKNPRGGKGSVPASRSNRPRVKSGGKQKGGKKK